jgi:hypothetical protein
MAGRDELCFFAWCNGLSGGVFQQPQAYVLKFE